MKFTALLEPAQEGGFVIKCVELPITTEGETRKEALVNLKEAIEGYIEIRTELLGKKSKEKKREMVEVSVRKASSALLA
jgi:predicted RNase H-like HicB family nuclease